jgi:hypothetical protein
VRLAEGEACALRHVLSNRDGPTCSTWHQDSVWLDSAIVSSIPLLSLAITTYGGGLENKVLYKTLSAKYQPISEVKIEISFHYMEAFRYAAVKILASFATAILYSLSQVPPYFLELAARGAPR